MSKAVLPGGSPSVVVGELPSVVSAEIPVVTIWITLAPKSINTNA
jgi:hypothetical protein